MVNVIIEEPAFTIRITGGIGAQGSKGDPGNGIASAVLNDDYTLTLNFTDGTSYTTEPIRGAQGETGNGIASAVLNPDYTLTLYFTDGTHYTTTSIRGAQGEKGEKGDKGDQGIPGQMGEQGERGEQGVKGDPGFSPIATVTKSGTVTTLTVTDEDGTTTAEILDGAPGAKGDTGAQGAQGIPGVSPTIAVSDIPGGHRVTITDADHPGGISFDVMDGSDADVTPLYTALDYGTKTVNIIEYATKYSNYWLNANGELVTASNYTSYEFDYDGTYTKFDATLYSNTFSGKAIAFVDGSGSVISTVGYTTTSGGSVYTDQPVPTGTKKIRLSNRHGGQNSGTAVASYVADTSGRIVGIEQELNHMPSDVLVADSSVVNNGVAKIPKGTNSILGAVRGRADRGISIEDGITYIKAATSEEMKAERNAYNPIVPDRQHISAYYALSKLAGADLANETVTVGTYPEASKSAIQNLIGGAITVSGSTPTINALANLRYICGEVSTLTVNLPASGCIDVTFESGSTPTVLTITPPSGVTVKWANGFDPTSLDANTTYEINIADGLGVACSWT